MLTLMKFFTGPILFLLTAGVAFAGSDWNQWRGPSRDGVLPDSPPLLNAVPEAGLKELWASEEIPSQDDGGLGSIVAANGRAYLSVVWHTDVPSETRTFTDLTMRTMGYQSPKGLGEKADALEKLRMSLPPTLRGAKLDEFAEKWIEDNLDKKQKQLYSGLVKGRLKKGPLATPFDDYEKMQAMVEKPFPNEAEFKKWVEAQGFADHVKKEVYEKMPPTKRVAEDVVVCIDLASGKTLWKSKAPGEPKGRNCSSTPAVVDGKVFALGSTHAYCVDASTGKQLWSAPLPNKAPGSSPAVVEGVMIVNSGSLVAFDTATGKPLWTQTKAGGGNGSPTFWSKDGKTLAICNSRNGLVACDLKTGAIAWIAPGGGDSTPAISGDTLAVQVRDPKLGFVAYKLSLTGAEKIWNHPFDPLRTQSSPIIHEGRVYLMDDNVHFCWDLATGKKLWETPVPSSIASPLLADGKIFVLINNGNNLQILKSAPERIELGKANVRAAWVPSPSIADGKLLLRMKNGIKAFDLAAKPPLP
ncbi:MAG: PQQ-like beta-propeller repeat protein [Verrucomicrobia bacterium]|nr:PQQ-like beta-propeller repeat protein [Verrucomicrobiota bacterium]